MFEIQLVKNSDLASITGLIVKDITLNPGYAIYGTWATRIIKDKSSGICVINLAIRKADNSVINTNTYVDIGILPDGFLPIYPTGASGIGEEPGAINHPVGIILFEGKNQSNYIWRKHKKYNCKLFIFNKLNDQLAGNFFHP